MALGGGIWTAQNKVMPGYYVNFSSASRAASALSARGTVAIPLELGWGPTGKVFTVTNADFQKNCQKIFGYAPDAPEMLPLRELFQTANTLHLKWPRGCRSLRYMLEQLRAQVQFIL